jgi:hypothetical protein
MKSKMLNYNKEWSVRYVKQKGKNLCGPTAILNLMKWIGARVTWKKDIGLCMSLCSPDVATRGMHSWVMDAILKHFPLLKVKKLIHMPKLKQLDEHLDSGRALVMAYLHKGGRAQNGHFMLCVGRTKKYYDVVNGKVKGKALSRISRKTMRKRLTTKRVEAGAFFYPVAWAVEPNMKWIESFI